MSVITVLRRLVVDLLEEAILAICMRVKMFDPPPSSPSPVSPHCLRKLCLKPHLMFWVILCHPNAQIAELQWQGREIVCLNSLNSYIQRAFPTKSRHRLERVISHQMCLHTGSAWTQATNPELIFCYPSWIVIKMLVLEFEIIL
jgi:hypothetical protein